MTKQKTLVLPVKAEYFNAIKSGVKRMEFRGRTQYWKKRIENRDYDFVTITLGYPKSDDHSRRMTFHYKGYDEMTITHPHFNNVPTDVFAIHVNQRDRLIKRV